MQNRQSRRQFQSRFIPSFMRVFVVFAILALLTPIYSYTRERMQPKPALAAVGINHQINFQGKLVNPDGTNVTDGNYSIVFSLYNVASAGTAIWTETQTVALSNGIFQVMLGSVTTLPGSVDFNTDNIYLGIKVGADAEMTPRVRFGAVPQAFNAEKLGGLDKTGFIQNTTSLQSSANLYIQSGAVGNVTMKIRALASQTADVIQVRDSGDTTTVFSISPAGTVTAGTWQGNVINASYGGTGISSYTTGDLLYASSASSLGKLSDIATGSCLISGGVGAAPVWGSCATGGGITGSGTNGQVSYFNGTGAITSSANLLFDGTTLTANSLAVTNNATIGGTLGVTGAITSSSTISGTTLNGTTGINTGAGAGTQRIDASGNLLNIGNITATGTATVGIYRTGDVVERTYAVSFPNGVANQKFDLYFSQFWGQMAVTATSTFANQNASGSIEKEYYLGLNPSNSVFTNSSRYSEASGQTPVNFALSDVTWDATNSRYRIQVVHRTSTGNTVYITVKAHAAGPTYSNEIAQNMASTAIYTTDATVFTAPTVSFTDNVGIGVADAGSYRLNVQGGDVNFTGNFAVGGTTVLTSARVLQNVTADASILTSGTINSARLSGSYTGITAVGTLTSLSVSGVITSSVATGTAPLSVASTTLVTNLNADMVDGLHASSFAASSGGTGYIQNQTASPQAAGFNINGNGTIGGTLSVNTASGASDNIVIGSTTTYANDANDGVLTVYGEQSGVMGNAVLTSTGTNFQISSSTEDIQFGPANSVAVIGGKTLQLLNSSNANGVSIQNTGTVMNFALSGAATGYTFNGGTTTVNGALTQKGGDFSLMDAGTIDSTAVRLFSNNGNLYLQNGSGNNVYFRNKTAGLTATLDNSGNFTNTGILTVQGTGNSTIAGSLAVTGAVTSGGAYLADASTDNMVANGDFEQGTVNWTGVTSIVTGGYSGNQAAQITGSNTLLSIDYIPVNPVTDVIQLEAYVKKSVAGTTPGQMYFGYIAYDANKAVITTAPCGTYCYFAAAGTVVPADGSWHKYSATTTGEGTSYPNFPVNTKYVRVLGLINYTASADAVSLIDHVTVRRVNTGALFVGNNFNSTNLTDQFQQTQLYTTSANIFTILTGSSADVNIQGGGLQIGGTNVITAARVLQNVTADTSILTSGTLSVARGGTGLGSYAVGDLLYASGASTLSRLADVATGSCLRSGGVGVAPSWGTCSASSTLQADYTASTGGTTPEIKLDSTRGGVDIQDADTSINSNLLTVRASNAGGLGTALFNVDSTGQTTFQNSTNSATAFQVKNASGNNLIQVNNTATNGNLITNPSLEADTSGWAARTGTTLSRTTTSPNYYYGVAAAQAVNTATTGAGINYPINLSPSTGYVMTAMLKMTVNGTVSVGYAADAATETTYVNTNQYGGNGGTGWYQVCVSFTTPASITAGAYAFIKQNDANARTMYIDGLRIVASGGTSNCGIGGGVAAYQDAQILLGPAGANVLVGAPQYNSPSDLNAAIFVQQNRGGAGLVVRATPENDFNSTTFSVQQTSGTQILGVNSITSNVVIAGGSSFYGAAALQITGNGGATALKVTGPVSTSYTPGSWTQTLIVDTAATSTQLVAELRVAGTREGSIRADNNGNVVLNGAGTGGVYLGYDEGTGGVFFGNGAQASGARVTPGGEIISNSANGLRVTQGSYGAFWRNDGTTFYLLSTAAGDVYGGWNTLRPFAYNLGTGQVDINGNGKVNITGTSVDLTGTITIDMVGTATTNGLCYSGTNTGSNTYGRDLVACNGTPSDYAEFYPTETNVEAGDVVATSPNLLTYEGGGADAETGLMVSMGQKQISILKKAALGDSSIGIISTAPYATIGRDIPTSAHRLPVAMNGRVPVKVNNEGGIIAAGDQLTLSTVPGYATKATAAGKTIAIALEPFNGTSGTIMAYVQTGYYEPPMGSVLQGDSLNVTNNAAIGGDLSVGGILNVSGASTLASLTVTGDVMVQGSLKVAGDIETRNITVNGHIITGGNAPQVSVGQGAGVEDVQHNIAAPLVSIVGNDTSGTITITTGTNTLADELAHIAFATSFGNKPRVVLTPANRQSSQLSAYYDATATDNNGFGIYANNAPLVSTTYSFTYLVVQ